MRTRLDGDRQVEIETLKGANMSLRRQALREIARGGAAPFDPGYAGTALLEDADVSTRVRAAGWRLRNTGYFVRRHRGVAALALVVPTQAAVAVALAVRARRPWDAPSLLAAFARGWWAGGR